MNCPDKEIMQDFVDGELSDTDARPIVKHIRSCDTCKAELKELFTLYNILNHIVDEDKCPSLDMLESYADKACSKEQAGKIAEHIDVCGRCKSYVWALQASEEELTNWQKQEEQAYKEFQAGELGYNTIKETLSKLLPAKIGLLDKGWDAILSFVLDLKDKTVENWPSFSQRVQLVGVLGFAETSDPETEAASVIMITTLYVSQLVSDGQIKPHQADIEAAVKEAAAKLGAGKELSKRLIETVPSIILKSR